MKRKRELSDRAIFVKFILFMIVCTALGYLAGRFLAQVDVTQIKSGGKAWIDMCTIVAPIVFAAINAGCCVVSYLIYQNSKRQFRDWDGKDEELIERIEYKLNYPVLLGNAVLILNFALFAVGIELTEICGLDNGTVNVCAGIHLAVFLAGLVWSVAVQNAAVKLCKEINPEKRGNIFQINFRKTWEESCDEAQKMMMYQSAYTAVHLTNKICLFLWGIAFVGMLVLDTGVLAVILVCVIHLVLNLSYMISEMKLEKGHRG